jgi:hypothetical protein
VDPTQNQPPNPYRSPAGLAEARGKLGWLVMLLLLWPIVMATVGTIIGFFVGRLSPHGFDPRFWNPATLALAGGGVFAVFGLVIGIRKVSILRQRLEEIHRRREELRHEMERRASGPQRHSVQDQNRPATDGSLT